MNNIITFPQYLWTFSKATFPTFSRMVSKVRAVGPRRKFHRWLLPYRYKAWLFDNISLMQRNTHTRINTHIVLRPQHSFPQRVGWAAARKTPSAGLTQRLPSGSHCVYWETALINIHTCYHHKTYHASLQAFIVCMYINMLESPLNF